jgi:membrane-associated protease RseP (regulator of RpoE activity)
MAYLLGVLVVAIGVAISIALHEVGHLVPAKRFGIRCTQYMIGFGPTLWSWRRGETEYGIKAVPLGGYVRMLGMFPPRPGHPARADTTGRWSVMIEQARHDAQREIGPQDADRLFYQRSVPKRLAVMLGGPVMNLVLAVVILTGLLMTYGVAQNTLTLGSVSQCVLPVSAPADATCTPSSTPAPAAAAGLRPGDRIVAFDGTPVTRWEQARSKIRQSGGETVQIGVVRDGRRLDLRVRPILDRRPALDADGQPVLGPGGQYVLEEVGFLGVTPAAAQVRQSPSAVPGYIGDALGKTFGVVLTIPQKMVGVAKAAFGDGERDPNGPISIVGFGRLAGEVASAQGSGTTSISLWDRLAFMLSLIASLNLALFVFNLIPLLPLDGGHIAGALWEGLRRAVARMRHRPDPGPVDVARALPVAYGVASLLIGMSVLLIYADIVRPARLGG